MKFGRGLWVDAFARIMKDRLALACLLIICVYCSVALLTALGWIATPWDVTVGESYLPPTLGVGDHRLWAGTDIFGRSVFYKAIHGTLVAMQVGLFASIIAVTIGIVLGAIAGYFGGWVDDLVVWFYTTFASIPGILLLMAISWILHRGVFSVCIAIGVTGWVGLCRVIRGEFIKHKNREYVLAAQSLGASHASRIFRHILPNVFHQVIISFSILFQSAIKSEVILSYLGLGVQGQPSWGIMIDDAKLELARGVWWQLGSATVFMFFLVLALNLFGDALRDALDPKLK